MNSPRRSHFARVSLSVEPILAGDLRLLVCLCSLSSERMCLRQVLGCACNAIGRGLCSGAVALGSRAHGLCQGTLSASLWGLIRTCVLPMRGKKAGCLFGSLGEEMGLGANVRCDQQAVLLVVSSLWGRTQGRWGRTT